MRKILAAMLVLGMATAASATVIDVVASSTYISTIRTAGEITNIAPAEVYKIQIVLNDNGVSSDVGGYPVNGYWLSTMDLTLTVTGPGVLAERGTGTVAMKHDAGFDPWAEPEPAVANNAIAYMAGTGPTAGIAGDGSPKLVWNLKVTVTTDYDGTVPIELDLTLNDDVLAGKSEYRAKDSDPWSEVCNADLGGLTLGVPEPMTMALLGLGGLGLIRRRRV